MAESRLLNDSELPLFCLEHHFSLCSTFLAKGLDTQIATCDLLIRDRPPHRNFLMAGGLEAIIQFVQNLRYPEDQVQFLLARERITKQFAEYLRNFRFTGDILAMPEGTVHYPGEPLLRVCAPIIEANLITDQLMILAKIDSLMLTKLARVHLALGGRARVSTGSVRAHGIDAGWRAARNTNFFDSMGFSNAAASKHLGMPYTGGIINANHAYIKSFPTELEAMRAVAELFPTTAMPMIDTYDAKQGIKNAITVAHELKATGGRMAGITIDSGDLVELTTYARKELDKAGLPEVKISVAGNMDEYKISELLAAGVPADTFLVVTEVVTSADAPKLEIVYKMAQLEEGDSVRHTAKFAPGKVSLPGKKQVFRILKDDKIAEDIIGLEEEALGIPLLQPIFKGGELVYAIPSMEENRAYVNAQLALLPDGHKDLFAEHPFSLRVSDQVSALLEEVRREHSA